MAVADDLKVIAEDLIAEFGNDLTFTTVTQGVYDPATGTSADINVPILGTITTNGLKKKGEDPWIKIPDGYKVVIKPVKS